MGLSGKAFFELVEEVFHLEADNSKIGARNSLVDRNQFWNDVYIQRPDEDEIFERFIYNDSSIMLLTGHVGTGKSTFIRHKFEERKLCPGLIIDMRGKMDDLDDLADSTEVRNAFYAIIREAYWQSLFDNGKYTYASGSDRFISIDYSLANNLVPISPEEFHGIAYSRASRKLIAIESLCRLHDKPQIREFLNSIGIANSDDEMIRGQLRARLEVSYKQIDEILSSLEWFDLVDLHQQLFTMKNDQNAFYEYVPHLMVIDNIDAVLDDVVKNTIFDCLIRIVNKLNRRSEYPLVKFGFPAVKCVLAVRDENVSRLEIAGGASELCSQITMSEGDHPIARPDVLWQLQASPNLMYEIIASRMRIVQKHSGGGELWESLERFVFDFWVDKSSQSLRTMLGNIDIASFSNDSIRLMLNFLHESAKNIIEDAIEHKILLNKIVDGTPARLLRGKIIVSLWKNRSINSIVATFSRGLLDKELPCLHFCYHRLVLIYLMRKSAYGHRIRIEGLWNDFNYAFGVDKDLIRRVLFDLFISEGFRLGELVTIYQRMTIRKPDDIKMKGIVRLNKRGFVFIDKIDKQLDFFGAAIAKNVGLEARALVDRGPKNAADYVAEVFGVVSKLANSHLFIWIRDVLPNFRLKDTQFPFEEYKRKFAFSEVFHLERVCDAHRYSIKSYVQEVFSGGKGLFLSEDQFDQIASWLKDISIPYPIPHLDPEIDNLINLLDTTNPLRLMWQTYGAYGGVSQHLQNIRAMNYGEMKKWYAEQNQDDR